MYDVRAMLLVLATVAWLSLVVPGYVATAMVAIPVVLAEVIVRARRRS